MARKQKPKPKPKKKKIGPPGSYISKPMYVKDPIWPNLSHMAYRSVAELALASGSPPYPYKMSGHRPAPEARLPKYKMTKGAKRFKGGPNSSD